MRLIEQREAVIGPRAIVRMTKEAAGSIKDLMARWRVLGVDGDLVRVEDVDDPRDTRTFNREEIERVSGGPEETVSLLAGEDSRYERWPEHDRWPECIREEGSLFDSLDEDEEFDPDCLLDDPDCEDE